MASVNGCQLVHDLDDRGVEGFRVIVSRTKSEIQDDGKGGQKVVDVKVERGPFFELKMANVYAHAWKDFDQPPEMPLVKTAQEIEDENNPKEPAK